METHEPESSEKYQTAFQLFEINSLFFVQTISSPAFFSCWLEIVI